MHWLVLQDKDRIIGSLQIYKEEKPFEKTRYSLRGFAVDQAYKGMGVKLLDQATQYLQANKINEVFLEVISVAEEPLKSSREWREVNFSIKTEKDKLASWYESHGFEFTGKQYLTPLSWQTETRKAEYVGKTFFREMKLTLQPEQKESETKKSCIAEETAQKLHTAALVVFAILAAAAVVAVALFFATGIVPLAAVIVLSVVAAALGISILAYNIFKKYNQNPETAKPEPDNLKDTKKDGLPPLLSEPVRV